MDYPDLTTGLPRNRTVFRSGEEHEETMRLLGFETEMRQVGRGSYRSDLAVRRTEQADLHAVRHNKAFWNLIEPPASKVALMMIRNPIGRVLVSGENVANDKLVFFPVCDPDDLRWKGRSSSRMTICRHAPQ